MYVQAMWGWVLGGGRGSYINLRGWRRYMVIYLMDKQQSPSQNWIPPSGEAGGRLGMSVGGGGGQDYAKNTK